MQDLRYTMPQNASEDILLRFTCVQLNTILEEGPSTKAQRSGVGELSNSSLYRKIKLRPQILKERVRYITQEILYRLPENIKVHCYMPYL
jgi:hypothetical protein